MFKVEPFKRLYLTEARRVQQNDLQPGRFPPQVDEIAAAIRGAVKDESEERFTEFEKAVTGERLVVAASVRLPLSRSKPIKTK